MKMRRRMVLKGLGGITLGLPFLEGLRAPGTAKAGGSAVEPYAIFFRQANGCASAQTTEEFGEEPERFWPSAEGQLTAGTMAGRALDELSAYRDRLLAVAVDAAPFDYGDGHARGVMQGLTARPPVVLGVGADSEAAGESIDHRIGRELNPGGRDSLFLYAGLNEGWLGGACESYRGPGDRRAPLHNPMTAYQTIMGTDGETLSELLVERRRSVNDVVRDQMASLLNNSALSSNDVERLEQHRAAIRDLEDTLACNLTKDQEAQLEGDAAGFEHYDGNEVLAATRAHMDVAVLAVACGYTRSVAIQLGNGNDGTTRFYHPDTGEMFENYHYISHRRFSHGADGDIIPNADLLHHQIDRTFAQTFRYLLDALSAYPLPEGSLLDAGVSVWHNDQSTGPGHSSNGLPYILAGSAGGYLAQGLYRRLPGNGTHCRLLNMIGSAAGLRDAAGMPIEDFGDPSLPKDALPELLG